MKNFPDEKKPPLRGTLAAFAVLAVFTAGLCVALGWNWLRQNPTHEELHGGAARFLFELRDIIRATGQIPWWSANFLLGHSMSGLVMCALPIACGLAGVAVFGDPAGIKIAALAVIPLSALAMFVFVRRLSGSPWTAVAAAILYIVSAQMLGRLADFEHWMGSYSYIFPPLILWAFLKIAEERSWRATAWLALAWSGMMLSYTKLAFLFTPLAAVFVLWIWFDQPNARWPLVRGTVAALVLVFAMSVVPLLPLAREFPLVAGFDFSPFAVWQSSFTLKNFLSVFDRGNQLFTGVNPGFMADRGQFYLGVTVFLAFAWFFWNAWRRSPWPESREGVLFRVFAGSAILALWLAHGPIPPLESMRVLVMVSQNAKFLPNWLVLVGSLAPLLVLYAILPRSPRRKWWTFALGLIYLLIPGFSVLENLPLFRGIRATWGFWEVGFLSTAVAAALALQSIFSRIPSLAARAALALALAALLLFDFSPYLSKFSAPGLPAALFRDFSNAQKHLAASPSKGRVYPFSSRYFFLRTPMESGRPLATEASWGHLQLHGVAALHAASGLGPDVAAAFHRIASVSHLLVDKKDPLFPPEFTQSLSAGFPKPFESEYISLLENKACLYPAFLAREYIAVEPGSKNLAHEFLTLAVPSNAAAIELGPTPATFSGLVGTASPSTGVFLPARDITNPGPAFERVAFAQPRTNPMEMRFDIRKPRDAWLVVSEAWHPDWKAFSGSAEIPVFKAYGGLLAVHLGRVREQLRFEFAPPPWYSTCLLVGAAAWILVAGMLLLMPLAPRPARDWWAGKKSAPATTP